MTVTHGTRKVKLFSTGLKSVHKVIKGYYLVLPNRDRHWIGESLADAARNINKLCDKCLTAETNWEYWVDYCFGYDVHNNLAWSNLDYSDRILDC